MRACKKKGEANPEVTKYRASERASMEIARAERKMMTAASTL